MNRGYQITSSHLSYITHYHHCYTPFAAHRCMLQGPQQHPEPCSDLKWIRDVLEFREIGPNWALFNSCFIQMCSRSMTSTFVSTTPFQSQLSHCHACLARLWPKDNETVRHICHFNSFPNQSDVSALFWTSFILSYLVILLWLWFEFVLLLLCMCYCACSYLFIIEMFISLSKVSEKVWSYIPRMPPYVSGQFVIYHGYKYRTLDGTYPDVARPGFQDFYLPLLDGWMIAEWEEDVRMVAESFPWGAHRIVHSGTITVHCSCTTLYRSCECSRGSGRIYSTRVLENVTEYKCSHYDRILIRQPIDIMTPTTFTSTAQFGTQLIVDRCWPTSSTASNTRSSHVHSHVFSCVTPWEYRLMSEKFWIWTEVIRSHQVT